jgi:hypothetical protein
MNEIKPGDYVRSFDYPGRSTKFYVEGHVLWIGRYASTNFDCYAIAVSKVVAEDVTINEVEDRIVFPPVNGTLNQFGNVMIGVHWLPENIDWAAL